MRLTNEVRHSVINKILHAKFSKDKEAIKLAESKFADDVYAAIKDISLINDMPQEWFACNQQFPAYFNGERTYQNMSVKRLLPFFVYNSGIRFALEHPLTQQRIVMKQQAHELQMAEEAVRKELTKVLFSVTTDKRLIEIWPEAEKWLPSKYAVHLPANVDVDKLRNLLKPL